MYETTINLITTRDKVRSCTRCELHQVAKEPVPISGSLPAKYVVVGEAPGRLEDHKGTPFVGPAGRLLRSKLQKAKIDPDDGMYMNVVSCYPGGTPKPNHIKACRYNLEIQLMASCTDNVLVCGGIALRSFLPSVQLKWTQGSLLRVHGLKCMVIWHPSFILQSKSKKVEQDIEIALKAWKLVLDDVIPADWLRHNWCVYCGGSLYDDGVTCRKHRSQWTKDSKWKKPEQMRLV